jgi:ribosome-associated protein
MRIFLLTAIFKTKLSFTFDLDLILSSEIGNYMQTTPLNNRDFQSEFQFSASRSGGPGGQNVNKVSSKVELRFNVLNSNLLDETEKKIIQEKLGSRINNNGELIMVSQSERSQLKNKEKVVERFYLLLSKESTF